MPRGGGVPRSAKEANNPILLKVQSLQLSFRPAGVSLGGGGGPRPPLAPPCVRPWFAGSDVRGTCKRITLTLSSVLTYRCMYVSLCIMHGRR